jgi:signal transduction histidine kinase
VWLASAPENGQVVVRVTDNGTGIAPEDVAKLGQRFVRVVNGAGAPEGSGMGLNFVVRFLRLSGGSFQISSPGLGHGATVTIGLPVAATMPGA